MGCKVSMYWGVTSPKWATGKTIGPAQTKLLFEKAVKRDNLCNIMNIIRNETIVNHQKILFHVFLDYFYKIFLMFSLIIMNKESYEFENRFMSLVSFFFKIRSQNR